MKHKIIVPTDFTQAAGQAVSQAVVIARQAAASVTLFHVVDGKSGSADEIRARLAAQAEGIARDEGVACDVLVSTGNVLEMICLAVCEKDYDMMVIGTHGFRGIWQKLFGTDILKLVSRVPVPVLVVQQDSPLIRTFGKIVLPVGSHDHFNQAVEAILLLAGFFETEVHLYSVQKPGFEWSKHLLANIAETTERFEKQGVRMIRVKEEQDGFSMGYARQTLRYTSSVGADILVMMSAASQENGNFEKVYKETLLLNEDRIPVFCAGGGAAD
jgi:nucleotide-binding universal stress UspA family protein